MSYPGPELSQAAPLNLKFPPPGMPRECRDEAHSGLGRELEGLIPKETIYRSNVRTSGGTYSLGRVFIWPNFRQRGWGLWEYAL